MNASAPSVHNGVPGSESSMGNQSFASPDNNSSPLMLSISTIASAIADASISTDPSQLAAMIIELSKKGRTRHRPKSAEPNRSEEPHSAEHVRRLFCLLELVVSLFAHIVLSGVATYTIFQ